MYRRQPWSRRRASSSVEHQWKFVIMNRQGSFRHAYPMRYARPGAHTTYILDYSAKMKIASRTRLARICKDGPEASAPTQIISRGSSHLKAHPQIPTTRWRSRSSHPFRSPSRPPLLQHSHASCLATLLWANITNPTRFPKPQSAYAARDSKHSTTFSNRADSPRTRDIYSQLTTANWSIICSSRMTKP